MHTKTSGQFAVDEDFLQFRTAPKMMMDRKRSWAENETDLKTKIPKTKLVRNWQICSFGTENENEIRSVSTSNRSPQQTVMAVTDMNRIECCNLEQFLSSTSQRSRKHKIYVCVCT